MNFLRQSNNKKFLLLFLLVLTICSFRYEKKRSYLKHSDDEDVRSEQRLKAASFKVLSPGYKTFQTTEFANVFAAQKNSIVKLGPELVGLTGIKLRSEKSNQESEDLKLSFSEPAKLLIGVFTDSSKRSTAASFLNEINFGKGKLDRNLVLQNAVTVAGLPSVDVYAVQFSKGAHTLRWNKEYNTSFIFLGVIKANEKIESRNVGLPDGRLWQPFIVEGFFDEKPLFEIIGGENAPVVNEGMPGTEGIQGGFEGGACVKVGGTYHLFPTERAGEKGVEAYYDRVKTRIGHWTSEDAIHWKRDKTIYQASGNYAITEDDNPMNDRRGAIWSYMPVFNKQTNSWYGYYLTYTVSKEISPNHSFGRIWRTESQTKGIEGIGGPYSEGKLIMEPGWDSQLWEGRQGVASFFPFPVKDGYLGFYAGAYPYLKREDYPKKMGQGWFVGLAKSKTLEGPWTRLDTTVNPVKSINPLFVENPIVYQLPNGLYVAMFDGGPEGWGHHFPNMMAYTTSKDGYHWSEAHYLPIQNKVQKWWDIMRTPLCLIPEGNDIYTIVYAAIVSLKRFHPMGMVKVRLNRDVMEAKMKEDK
jgi:hypothetical protein